MEKLKRDLQMGLRLFDSHQQWRKRNTLRIRIPNWQNPQRPIQSKILHSQMKNIFNYPTKKLSSWYMALGSYRSTKTKRNPSCLLLLCFLSSGQTGYRQANTSPGGASSGRHPAGRVAPGECRPPGEPSYGLRLIAAGDARGDAIAAHASLLER